MWKKYMLICLAIAACSCCLFGFADQPVYDDNGNIIDYTNEYWRLDYAHLMEAINHVAGDPNDTSNQGATAHNIMGDIEFFTVITTMAQTYDPAVKQEYSLIRRRDTYTLTCYNGDGPWDASDNTKITVSFDQSNTTTWQVANSIAKTWSHDKLTTDAGFFKEIGNSFKLVINYIQVGFTYVRMIFSTIFDSVKLLIKLVDVPIYLLGIGELINI